MNIVLELVLSHLFNIVQSRNSFGFDSNFKPVLALNQGLGSIV